VKTTLASHDSRIMTLENNYSSMKSNMSSLQGTVSGLSSKVSSLESQIRGLRTDEWPEDEHNQADQVPPEDNPRRRLEELFPFMRDDPDIPF
uniref:hypothetical protein n=1 Tax=Marivita sp. TaxID=2003365 RepID=UPI0025BFB730